MDERSGDMVFDVLYHARGLMRALDDAKEVDVGRHGVLSGVRGW